MAYTALPPNSLPRIQIHMMSHSVSVSPYHFHTTELHWNEVALTSLLQSTTRAQQMKRPRRRCARLYYKYNVSVLSDSNFGKVGWCKPCWSMVDLTDDAVYGKNTALISMCNCINTDAKSLGEIYSCKFKRRHSRDIKGFIQLVSSAFSIINISLKIKKKECKHGMPHPQWFNCALTQGFKSGKIRTLEIWRKISLWG